MDLESVYTWKNYLMCFLMADKALRPVLYSKLASDLSKAFDEVINCTGCSQQNDNIMTSQYTNGTAHAQYNPVHVGGGAGLAEEGQGHASSRETGYESGEASASAYSSAVSVPEVGGASARAVGVAISSREVGGGGATELSTSASVGVGRSGYDRSISTSSSCSASSQKPLLKPYTDDQDDDIV